MTIHKKNIFFKISVPFIAIILLFFINYAEDKFPKPLEKFRFIAISDTHISSPESLILFRKFLFTIKKINPDFLIILGDVCGQTPEYLPQIKHVADLSGLTVHFLPGNHDDDASRHTEWWLPVFGKMYYSFKHKGGHFILNWSQKQPIEWLKQTLADINEDEPIIFCQHYSRSDKLKLNEETWSLLVHKKNVLLALSGDIHYNRLHKTGNFINYTLSYCFLKPNTDNEYAIIDIGEDGSVIITPKRIKELELELEAPPDEVPTVKITSHKSNAILNDIVTFKGIAADDKGITSVEFLIDNKEPWQKVKGTNEWKYIFDTKKLSNGHHLFTVCAVDTIGQRTIFLDSILCLINNNSNISGITFQQGINGYLSCSDMTVRLQGNEKPFDELEGDVSDLETWIGEDEYSEFYIKFDLSNLDIPQNAKIKKIILTLFCSRQNNLRPENNRGWYRVGIMKCGWDEKITFKTRPQKEEIEPVLKLQWQEVGGVQTIIPPKVVEIDLSVFKDKVEQWLKNPAINYGWVFYPDTGKSYNISFRSSRYKITTLHPILKIELEK